MCSVFHYLQDITTYIPAQLNLSFALLPAKSIASILCAHIFYLMLYYKLTVCSSLPYLYKCLCVRCFFSGTSSPLRSVPLPHVFIFSLLSLGNTSSKMSFLPIHLDCFWYRYSLFENITPC